MSLLAAGHDPVTELLDDYLCHCDDLGLKDEALRARRVGAERFLGRHPDLEVWWRRPMDARLTDLSRIPMAWPLVGWSLLTGRCQADIDFLVRKKFGHSLARAVEVLYADDIASLRAASTRLGMTEVWTEAIIHSALPLVLAFFGRSPATLDGADLDLIEDGVRDTPMFTVAMRRSRRGHLHGLRRLLYEAGILDHPARIQHGEGPTSRERRLKVVGAAEIRRTILRYLELRSGVLRPATIEKLLSSLAIFGEFLTDRYPELTSLAHLERSQIEAYFTWSAARTWRGRFEGRPVGPWPVTEAVITLRSFLEDIGAWGWAEAPPRRLVFSTDTPKLPSLLPRALPPDVDAALMAAVAGLEDDFARIAITLLRLTGLRIGELLDLELDCVLDYGSSGRWLRVPLGKLNSERSVPLHPLAEEALEQWCARRGRQRAIPHPRDSQPTDFVFMRGGRRLRSRAVQQGLAEAVRVAGLTTADGAPLHVVPHQLRHTYATELLNAGMSLQALMALLGHSSPEMTLRYATLASPILKTAYEVAMGKVRPRIPVATMGRPAVPDRVEWLAQEMLKTRVAHGYCARELVAEACPYANVCESCANFVATPEFMPVLESQLDDVVALRADAATRGWESEVSRHDRVITSLEGHLTRLRARS